MGLKTKETRDWMGLRGHCVADFEAVDATVVRDVIDGLE